jgi:cell shape-determining protein MreC
MATALDDYFAALERLKTNQPKILPKGTGINKDTVAIEAGRKRGSIKKSRAIFSDLIAAISDCAKNTSNEKDDLKRRVNKLSAKASDYKEMYEKSLARELSLIREIDALKTENKSLKASSIKLIK